MVRDTVVGIASEAVALMGDIPEGSGTVRIVLVP